MSNNHPESTNSIALKTFLIYDDIESDITDAATFFTRFRTWEALDIPGHDAPAITLEKTVGKLNNL